VRDRPGLLDLANRRIVRLIDIVFIQKDADGAIHVPRLNCLL
jgi:hypothetical protein